MVKHISLKKPIKIDKKCLPDYECIKIMLGLGEIKSNPKKAPKVSQMPGIGLRVNLYSCFATNKNKEVKIV